jgi:uncharacterized protein YuzE
MSQTLCLVEAKVLYLKFNDYHVAKTIPAGEGKYLDVAASGKAVGLEIIFPQSIPQEEINAIIGLKGEQIKLLTTTD